MLNENFLKRFSITAKELRILFLPIPNPEAYRKAFLIAIGTVFLPITLIGALFGYIRGYNRFMLPKEEYPRLAKLRPIVKLSIIAGAIIIWLCLVGLLLLIIFIYKTWDIPPQIIVGYIVINLILSLIVFAFFKRWRNGTQLLLIEARKFGSARFAREDELEKYTSQKGFYIGGGYSFNDKGHLLTVAGTRGGKGTNLIIPNLLGVTDYKGSWVVIDPKGENAAITATYQKSIGRKVVVLNPWDLLSEHLDEAQCYNPLDLLADKTSIHLVDDVQIIAEMLVPIEKGDKNRFFTDNARAIVTGLLMHLVVTQEAEDKTLGTLWKWVRYTGDKWQDLVAEMRISDAPVNGEIIRNAGNEIVKLMDAGEETFGNIISTVLQCTDFLKSPALQKSMQSGLDPYSLTDGDTALYIIIPADKLNSHYRWLRLVVTTTLRAVIRKPKNRVCFLLDEFAALGYIPEIETALSTYAGYEVTVWPILQSLIQLKNTYGDNWETFTANSTVRHFFSVNDNFTADYVSQAIGQTSNITNKGERDEANARQLVTADELRRSSGEYIFTFIESNPVTYFAKMPYYKMQELAKRAGSNPYL